MARHFLLERFKLSLPIEKREMPGDMFDDGDGQGLQTVTRPSKRPYNVSSTSLPTQTFVRLSSEFPRFLEEAHKLAPASTDTSRR